MKQRLSTSPEYHAWRDMHSRCSNKRNKDYQFYGGRGIAVCERWGVYENFLLDMGRKPSSNLSLDRIDNDKSYSPENCRWATIKQQNGNKQRYRLRAPKLPLSGAKKTMVAAIRSIRERLNETQTEFAVRFGVDQATVSRWETGALPKTGAMQMHMQRVLQDIDRVYLTSTKR